MPQVPMLVELIGGAKRVLSADPSGSVEDIAGALAAQLDLSLTGDDGAALAWRFFAPKVEGGFGPADRAADLTAVAAAMTEAQAAGTDLGFAGPGEHEGAAYLFRVRLFVPKAVPPPPPPEPEPIADDEEALDLTNMDSEDALETVRRVETPKKKRRRRKPPEGSGDEPRRRKRKTGRHRTVAPDAPDAPTGEPTVLKPAAGRQEESTALPDDHPPPMTLPPMEGQALRQLVATPALDLAEPSPGDKPITQSDTPAPTPQAVTGPQQFAETRVLARDVLADDDELPNAAELAPKAGRSGGIASKGRSGGIPKKGRSTGIPKKGRSTGIPKKGRSTGIPKKARSSGIPKQGRTTGIPKGARNTGGLLGLGIAVLILLGVLAATGWVLTRPKPEPTPQVQAPPPAPTAAPKPWLADRFAIAPIPGLPDNDPVSAVLVRYEDMGLTTGPDAEQVALLGRLGDEAARWCGDGRMDACLVQSRLQLTAYRGCLTTGCDKQQAQALFLGAVASGQGALTQAMELPAEEQGQWTKRLALQSVRLGGQSMRLLDAKGAGLAALARKSCQTAPLDGTAECAAINE